MSGTFRTVAAIAGTVALVATGVGAFAAPALAGTIGTIGTVATITSAAATAAAQITAPTPIARGSPARVVVDVEPARPYIVGQVMTGGVLRHDVAYGADVAGVPNPYRWQVRVLSGVGPIQGIVSEHFDFEPIDTSFYGPNIAFVQNLGDRPQSAALVPPYGAAPGWDSTSRLSGCAHVGLNFLFDRDGEVFAAGLPNYTALCDGEKVYDPRQDSTFTGGIGPCRLGQENTYVYSRNPAIHAAMYAYGRFEKGVRMFGLGQPEDTIDWAAIVDWANDCDANGWTVNMILTEGGTGANLREQRVRNMDDLCAAGGGRWYPAGGLMSFDWHRPRLSIATLTDDDILASGGGTEAVPAVSDRFNGVRPQYVSPDHNWQQITAEEIVGSTYRTEDGQALTKVYPLNGVTNVEQAGELASYAMADSRELGPIDIEAKASWRFYRPGDCITINSSLAAYQGQAVINQRRLNPENLAVSLSFKSETAGKHAFALGKVAVPPPTPTLAQTSQERDLLADAALKPRAVDVQANTTSGNSNLVAFSLMEDDRGWQVSGAADDGTAMEYFTFDGDRFAGSVYENTAAGQVGFVSTEGFVQIKPDQRYSVQGNVDARGESGDTPPSNWRFRIEWYDAGQNFIISSNIATGSGDLFRTQDLAGFVTAPSNARLARVAARFESAGAGTARLTISNPMVSPATDAQTEHPAFVPGPNSDDGADVTDESQVTTSQPAAFDIQASSAGVTTSDLATITRSIELFRGGVKQTSGVTVGTITRSPSGSITVASPSISSGTVTVTLTKADAAGSITVPVIFDGKTYNVTIDVRRTLAAPSMPPADANDSYTDQTWANVSGTVFNQVAGDGNCESDGSGVVRIRYAASYTGGRARCKVQYRLESGSTWIDVPGSDVTGSTPITVPGEEEPGEITFGFTNLTGLSADTLYRFRLLALSVSGPLVSWNSPVFAVEEP
ncbi:MAG: hypothetical protein AAGB23_05190 [Pseudomonadota bacterium]